MLEARVPLPNDKYVYRKLVAHFQFEILADGSRSTRYATSRIEGDHNPSFMDIADFPRTEGKESSSKSIPSDVVPICTHPC